MKLLMTTAAFLMTAAAPVAAQTGTFNVGPQTSSYSGLTRGYFFTAPTAFRITSLFVEDEASTANQWAEVVRFTTLPPLFPTTTNAFTSLGYFANQAGAGAITTSIDVAAGDVIGILGSRGTNTVNSYGTDPYTGQIFGQNVAIARLGFQSSLVNGKAADLFSEPGSNSYGRIAFTYAAGAVPEPASWAMMIVGVGGIGASLRRRRAVSTTMRFA